MAEELRERFRVRIKTVEAMEFIRRSISEVLADLPEICAAHLPSDNSAILIKRGERGYCLRWEAYDGERFNKHHGITDAQVGAMHTGSMFGFAFVCRQLTADLNSGMPGVPVGDDECPRLAHGAGGARGYREGLCRLVRFTLDSEDFEPWSGIGSRYPTWTPNQIARLEQSGRRRGAAQQNAQGRVC